MSEIKLEDDQNCFVCGENNRAGLKLKFCFNAAGELQCDFKAAKRYQGFRNITHGGVLALIMDEAMVNLLWKKKKPAVTAELNLRFKKPAVSDEKLCFKAGIEKEDRRLIWTYARCFNVRNELVAEATAKCFKID